MVLVPKQRTLVMNDCRATRRIIATLLMTGLAPVWSQSARAQVKLEHKFREGTKLTYKTRSRTRQVLTSMGKENVTEENSTIVTSRTVGKRRGDSSVPIEEKTESLRAVLSLPEGINVNFNSTDRSVKIDDPELAFIGDEFKLLSESAYTVVLDDKNKVKAIEGTDKLLKRAETLNQDSRDFIKDRFESRKLKTKFEQALQILPDTLVRSDEPWERTELFEIGDQALIFRKKYQYAGTEKKRDKTLDKITSKVIEVTYKQDPETKSPLKVKKTNLKVESSDGTILFDREAGHSVSSKEKTQIKGDMTFSAAGTEFSNTLDLRIDTETELQSPSK
jgi:hypothetical protein